MKFHKNDTVVKYFSPCIFILFSFFLSCVSNEENRESEFKILQKDTTIRDKVVLHEAYENSPTQNFYIAIQGIWGEDIEENSSFKIGQDSILYTESLEKYAYRLQGNSITVYFPDGNLKMYVEMQGDSILILKDEELEIIGSYIKFR